MSFISPKPWSPPKETTEADLGWAVAEKGVSLFYIPRFVIGNFWHGSSYFQCVDPETGLDLFFQIGNCPGCFMVGTSGMECFVCPDSTCFSTHFIPLVDADNKAISPIMLAECSGISVDIPTKKELLKRRGCASTTQQVETCMWDKELAKHYRKFEEKERHNFSHHIETKASPTADAVARRHSDT